MCTKCEKLIAEAQEAEARERRTANRLSELLGGFLGVDIPEVVESKPPTPTHARWSAELGRAIVETHVASHVLEDIVLGKACSSVFQSRSLIPPTRTEGRLKMLEHVQAHLRAAADRLNVVIGIQTKWVVEEKLKDTGNRYPTYKEPVPAQRHVDESGAPTEEEVRAAVENLSKPPKNDVPF